MDMGKVNVMLIDDDMINNIANERLLKKTGIDIAVTSFLSGEEAIDYLLGNDPLKPDVILLDVNMPMMSGWEFLEKFEPFGIKSHVIMLTSSVDPKDERKAAVHPLVRSFNIKPLDVHYMKNLLRDVQLCQLA